MHLYRQDRPGCKGYGRDLTLNLNTKPTEEISSAIGLGVPKKSDGTLKTLGYLRRWVGTC